MSERYHPDAEQVALAASIGESLASLLPLSRLRESDTEQDATWATLEELGIFGVSTPEAEGGGGLGAVEEALIVHELGRRAVAPAVLATIGASLLGTRDRSGGHRAAAGYRRGDRVVLLEDPAAQRVLVRSGVDARLFALPASTRSIDARLWTANLCVAESLAAPIARADAEQVLHLRLLDAAALSGVARAALEMAVGYANVREQFGRPIGSFQAIKHHCANMALAARCALDQVSFAAVALDARRDDAALQVDSALQVAGSAALETCGTNIQVHGGIGFSDEADPHRLLKRARLYLELAGGLEASLERIADCPPGAPLASRSA
ncbi:MAG: acyl-CoA dehydrogenase family protein [Myxococcales bacterium]|nr:acyl-CoA dehydrogenase family protein [Myxococcales bacterium]